MVLSVVLLFLLRFGATRGRVPAAVRESSAQPSGAELEAEAPHAVEDPTDSATPVAARAELEATPLATGTQEDPSEDFDPGTLAGRIVSAGLGVADVELRLFPAALERRERHTPLAETKSDAEGRFRFRGLEPHARHALHAQHPDFLPKDATLFPGHAEELELERAATVGGTVRSAANGQPLAGVEVAIERWHFGPAGMNERVSSSSDAEGRWRLPWARPGIERFSVLRSGFAPERREFQVVAEGGDGYEILLGDASALTLELVALESGAVLAETFVLYDNVRVRTDAKGLLNVPPAQPGREDGLQLTLALPEGCSTQVRRNPAPLGLVRVPLSAGGSVRGRVLDAAGAPVSGALVRVSGGGRPPSTFKLPEGTWINPGRNPTTRSGADGSFTLVGQPPREGLVELRAGHPEHPPGRSEPFEFAQLGQTVEHDITLRRGGRVAGTIRLDGAPASALVHWEGSDGNGGWTRANDRGDYRIAGVPAGEVSLRPRLEGEDEDFARPEDTSVWVEEDQEVTADFELGSRRTFIRGRVIDAAGAPVAEAEVEAWPSDEDEWDLEEQPRAECDAEGRFELAVPDLPGLVLDLSAHSGPRRASAHAVQANGPEVELVLPALSTLALRVVDALRHEPVQGFQLYWRDSAEGEFERLEQGGRRLSSGPDGTFLAELPAGRLDLAVSARNQGFLPARRDGIELLPERDGQGPALEIELEVGVELELALPLANSEALRQLQRGRVSLASAQQWAERERGGEFFQQEVHNAQTLRPDANGVVRLKAMPSGHYQFRGTPKGFVFRPAEFELPPVAALRLTIALEPKQDGEPKQPKQGERGD